MCRVYSFKCMRVNVGGTDDLDIPPNQNWIDVNFGSKTITMFVMSMSEVSSNVLNKINMVVCLNNLAYQWNLQLY